MDNPHMIVPEFNDGKASGQNLSSPSSPITPFESRDSTPSILPKKPRKLLYIILGVVAVIILLAIAFLVIVFGLGKTALGQSMQDKLWQNTIETANENIAEYDIAVTYTDKGTFKFVPSDFARPFTPEASEEEFSEIDDIYSFTIADFTASTNIISYFNLVDKEKPKLDLHLEGSVTNNSKEFTADGDIRLKDTEAFAKYNFNTNVEDLINYIAGDTVTSSARKNEWFRTTNEADLKSMREAISADGNDLPPEIKEKQAKFKQLLKDNRLFDIKYMSGLSVINKTPVVHYELTLNKDKLRTVVMGMVNDTLDSEYDKDARDFAEEIVDAWLEKIDVSNYEVWVGVTDHKIYKSSMTLNALSIVDALTYLKKAVNDSDDPINKSLDGARSKSRDAKRLSDMRQLASAVELYYNDNNAYPPALGGKPVGLTPTYIFALPEAPLPVDGTCDEFHNTYWYKRPTETSYTYAFCLGGSTGGLPAGNQTLSQNGIQSENPASENSSNADYSQAPDPAFESFKSAIINTIRNLTFSAELKIEYTGKNFGVERDIESPTEYTDESSNDDIQVNFPAEDSNSFENLNNHVLPFGL